MPHQFIGPPQSFRPDEWKRLQKLLEAKGQIDIKIIVDLPAVGAEGYDTAVAAMENTLLTHLGNYYGDWITIERRTRTGGRAASCTFRIRKLEEEE